MQTPAVQLIGVSKRVGRKTIVDRLSFDIRPGEVFGFLGPNGAGKTTTIRMMVGLIAMSEGDVRFGGISVKDDFRAAIAQVGAIVENPEMYKALTGYQNLRQYARMAGNVTKARIDEVVRQVDLAGRIHDKVRTYSLGMRQRLGLAQALLHKPKALILDEPTNGLDPAGIRDIRLLLRRLAAEDGIAVVVSSHLLAEMELMCDRFAIIQEGRLKAIHATRGGDGDGDETAAGAGQQLPQGTALLLRVEPLGAAQACLAAEFPAIAVRELEGGELRVEAGHDKAPAIVSALAGRELRIFKVQPVAKSLEDTFIELTEEGGDRDAHGFASVRQAVR
ncbi:MAG: ABC transporter ATP-binding protein [Paenibacillaceae bacterium]|nr:ABC transporter ATP-binding protein [Paenibacillaceae bacterium]